jgi:hypothetical protein
MFATLVRRCASTAMNPRSSAARPAAARFSSSVTGLRPTATSTMSNSRVSGLLFVYSPVDRAVDLRPFSTDSTLVESAISMPCFLRMRWSVFAISRSVPVRICAALRRRAPSRPDACTRSQTRGRSRRRRRPADSSGYACQRDGVVGVDDRFAVVRPGLDVDRRASGRDDGVLEGVRLGPPSRLLERDGVRVGERGSRRMRR